MENTQIRVGDALQQTQECWQTYPRLSFPASAGSRGRAQKRARDACIAAVRKGKEDPKLSAGPRILEDPTSLWRVKHPWTERPVDNASYVANILNRVVDPLNLVGGLQTGGARLLAVAEGWRPPHLPGEDRFRRLEHAGTIFGGIVTLADSDIYPYINYSDLIRQIDTPGLRSKQENYLHQVQEIVDRIRKDQGLPKLDTLQEKSEYIRQEVMDKGLEKPAWYARGIFMLQAGQRAHNQRKSVESAAAMGAKVAGGATMFFPPVGLTLKAVGLTMTAASARSNIEAQRNKNLEKKWLAEYQSALVEKQINTQKSLLENQIIKLKEKEFEDALGANQLAQLFVSRSKIVAWAGAGAVILVTSYLVTQRVRESWRKN